MTKLRKLLIGASGVAIATVALMGCTSTGGKGQMNMSPQDVVEHADRLYSAAQEVLGQDGWDLDRQWFSCGLQDDVALIQLSVSSRLAADLPGRPADLVDRVKGKWATFGVHAETAVDTTLDPVRYILSDPPYLAGVNPDGSLSDLWIGTGIVKFSYVSPCVPGDIFELQPQLTSSPEPTVIPPSTP